MLKSINHWSTLAEMIWLTTWKETAQTYLAPKLGLVDFPYSPLAVVHPSPFNDEGRPYKYATFRKHCEASHPDRLIIWIDDEVAYFKIEEEAKGVEGTMFSRPNTMLVSPFNGLCPHHVEAVNQALAAPESINGKCIELFYPGEQYFVRDF